jgi:hypothetical protein
MAEYAYTYVHVDEAEPQMELEADLLYRQELAFMQEGRWSQAARTIVELDRRYPDAPELRQLRQQLSLHLSAEQTWKHRRFAPPAQLATLRALVIGNLILYPLLAALYLWARRAGLL